MAGADSAQAVTRAELERMILGCGFVPVNRDALFHALPSPAGEEEGIRP
jgi:aminodeoxyfutalosine synthase